MRTFNLKVLDRDRNETSLYWEVYLFKKRRYAHNWYMRHRGPESPLPRNFGAAVSDGVKKLDGIIDHNCLGFVLFAEEQLDLDTLTHESVHMAKAYLKRIRKLRDEEELASATATFAESLITHFWRARKRI